MKLSQLLVGSLVPIILSGCVHEHRWTTQVCKGRLFVERFNDDPAGLDKHFLTDSTTFRMEVGRFDNEHEGFHYSCEGDSIYVKRFAMNDEGVKEGWKIVAFSVQDLQSSYPIE